MSGATLHSVTNFTIGCRATGNKRIKLLSNIVCVSIVSVLCVVCYKGYMKRLQYLIVFLLALAFGGAACAYSASAYPQRPLLIQHPVMARAGGGMIEAQQRPRRLLTPAHGAIYQRGGPPQQNMAPAAPPRARMTVEEKRALRRQINDVNRGLYNRNAGIGGQP